jgi:hypothetical protein
MSTQPLSDPEYIRDPTAYVIGNALANLPLTTRNSRSAFGAAATASPVDMTDVIDRTQPQSFGQKLSERWYDAQVKYAQMLQTLKQQAGMAK